MFLGLCFIFFCSAFKINALPAGCPNLPDMQPFIQTINVQPSVDEEELNEAAETDTHLLSDEQFLKRFILSNEAILIKSFVPTKDLVLFPKNDGGLYQKMTQALHQLDSSIIYNNERSEVALNRLQKTADLLEIYLKYDEEEIKKNFCEIDSFLYSYFNRKSSRHGLMGGFSNCRTFLHFTAPKISMYLADHPFVKKYYEKSIHLFEKVSRPFFEKNQEKLIMLVVLILK